MYEQKISDFIDSHRDDMIDLLKAFVAVPSIVSEREGDMPFGKDVHKMLKLAEKTSEEMGFRTENFENQAVTADLNNQETSLQILCHLDVVPVNEKKWNSNPFEAVIKDNVIYGRGVCDNKGATVSALYALYVLKELNIPLRKNVRLYLGGCEETGCTDLKNYLTDNKMPEYVFVPDACYPVGNGERGRITINGNKQIKLNKTKYLKSGTALNIVPEYAEARFANVTESDIQDILSDKAIDYDIYSENGEVCLKIFGKSTHTAHPEEGENALSALIDVLKEVDDENDFIAKLSSTFPHNAFHGEGLGFANADFSFSVTQADYDGEMFNFTADGRIGLKENTNEIESRVIKRFSDCAEIEVIPPHHVDENSEIVRRLMKIYNSAVGDDTAKPYILDAMTYAHYIDNAVIFGAVCSANSGNAHGNNESLNLDSLVFGAKIIAQAIIEFCE